MSERTITVKIDCEDKTCSDCSLLYDNHMCSVEGWEITETVKVQGSWDVWVRCEECIKAEQREKMKSKTGCFFSTKNKSIWRMWSREELRIMIAWKKDVETEHKEEE